MQLFIFRTDSKCSVLEIVCLLSQILLNCCWEVVRGMKKQLSWIRSPRLLPAATCSQGWWELQVMPAYLKEYFFLCGHQTAANLCITEFTDLCVWSWRGKKRNPGALGWTIGNRIGTGELKGDGARCATEISRTAREQHVCVFKSKLPRLNIMAILNLTHC